MRSIVKSKPLVRQLFLLDRTRQRPTRFSFLHPKVVRSTGAVRQSVARATKHSLWVSYEQDLTEALVKSVCGPSRALGNAILIHALNPRSIPALTGCFHRFAFASVDAFLPPEELAEALHAENAADLLIGGSVNPDNQSITFWRGNLEPLTVPFSAFETSGDGISPDFTAFSMTDSGQTIRFGEYEAATDALLYELDPEFRRRLTKRRQQSERSFGASVRRLRKQRGLRRTDFEPDITSKTIARIEQGKVQRIHKRTLEAIAQTLRVTPDEIETF